MRQRIFGTSSGDRALRYRIKLSRLRWLGHVLRMHPEHLLYRVQFSTPSPGWKKPVGGQRMTWYKNMKNSTKSLGKVGAFVRLPGWGPKDEPSQWLATLQDMAMNRQQWRSCCHFLSGLGMRV